MKPYQWLAWTATALLLGSACLAAFNFYPYYAYGFIIANTTWMIVGMLWKERALFWSNAGLNAIYIVGLLLNF